MLKQAFAALLLTASLSGCLAEHRQQQRDVAPSYVARCPAGYRFDGHDCHRDEPRPAVVVEIGR